MNLKQLVNKAKDKSNFADLKAYIKFCDEYLNYISNNLQAIIVSQNENHYRFYQYKREGNFQITRPINSNLMYDAENFMKASQEFLKVLKNIKTIDKKDETIRNILNNATYTIWRIRANYTTKSATKWSTHSALNWSTYSAANCTT